MIYGSVCSGVEAASVAWHPLGWKAKFFSEIEPFPSAVLEHHWPEIPNHGDMQQFEDWGYERGAVDVLVGGTPCQSFSIAGLRGGLRDSRGNLALTYCRMVDKLRPRWCVWENVPGVLSSHGGKDFSSIISALAELGYSLCWRVLDAQNFGVPQRRRRVFLVGCSSGDWRDPAAVLFEPGCGTRDFETRKETREDSAETTTRCFAGNIESNVAATLQTTMHDYSRADGFNTVLHSSDIAPAITSSGPPYSRTGNQRVECDALVVHGTQDPIVSNKAMPIQRNQGQESALHQAGIVRRLTPVEAERLQGFPDGYTDIGWNGKATPDSHRYKAMGNSMAVPVMRWIGKRIQARETNEL